MKILIILFILSLDCEAQKGMVNKGLLLYQSSLGSKNLTSDRFWFLDSTVIYEQNSDYQVSDDDSIIFEGYTTYKYSFFDLRTLQCQDYFSFSDTASVESNYKVDVGDAPGWNFYIGLNKKSLDSMFQMADTSIGQKNYKRIRYKERLPEYNYIYEETYFFLCDAPYSNLLHIDKRLEQKFPGCVLEKIDMHQLSPYTMRDSTLFIIKRGYLTKEEEKIFEKWKKNALETKLPVLTIQEVRRKPFLPIEYKKHPFYKQQLQWELNSSGNQ